MKAVGVKITLAQARAQGDTQVAVWCDRAQHAPWCSRSARFPLAQILARFGAHRRLDDLPFRCTACGSREVEVRATREVGPGGLAR